MTDTPTDQAPDLPEMLPYGVRIQHTALSPQFEAALCNALRRALAERDRRELVEQIRECGHERADRERDITRLREHLESYREILDRAKAAGDLTEERHAFAKMILWRERAEVLESSRAGYTRLILKHHRALLLHGAAARPDGISPDLPEDLVALLQDCLADQPQSPAANPPTREGDPATE